MKKFNKQPKTADKILDDITEQDRINFLAVMCRCCSPLIVRGRYVKIAWSEYVPQNEDDVALAKYLFSQSGIDLKIRYMQLNSWVREPWLCSRYFLSLKTPDIVRNVNFMKQVDAKSQDLVKRENRDAWWEIQEKLMGIRQDFYEKTK